MLFIFYSKSTSGKGTVVPFPIAQKPSEDDIVPEELTVPPKVDREEDLLEQLEELNIRDKESTKQLPEDFKPTIRREKKVKKKPEIPAKQKVEACLEEWFTIDTLRVLFGDSHVKEVLMERGCAMDKILSTLGDDTFENPEFKEQYIQLCRNLDMREKLEEKAVMDELGKMFEFV